MVEVFKLCTDILKGVCPHTSVVEVFKLCTDILKGVCLHTSVVEVFKLCTVFQRVCASTLVWYKYSSYVQFSKGCVPPH